jgi:Domain of unknown function (DUF4157)
LSYAPAVKDRQSSSSSSTTASNKTHSYTKNNVKLASKSRSSINNIDNNNSQRQPDTSQHYQTPVSSIQDISRSIRPVSSLTKNNNNNNSLIQPKLRISQPNDVYEQEADRIAEKVMAMSSMPPLSFSAVPVIGGGDNRTKAKGKGIGQKKCTACQMKGQQQQENIEIIEISRKKPSPHASNLEASDQVSNEIINNNTLSSSSSGSPLDANTKEFMETRFRYNFSKVRIHTDAVAAASANSLNALAYTLGNNIVFAKGQYQTGTESGKKLLAHELTHVIQQQNKISQCIQRSMTMDECESYETEVQKAHDRAIAMTWNAILKLDSYDGLKPVDVRDALNEHFHSDSKFVADYVREILLTAGLYAYHLVQYECHATDTKGNALATTYWCVPFTDIILWKPWFEESLDTQASTLVHEWMHKYHCSLDLGYDWEESYKKAGTLRALFNADPYGELVEDIGT